MQQLATPNSKTNHPLTVSIASESAAAFRFSLAFTFAVVESTAVAIFAAVSFFGGVAGAGYANRLGRAFEMNSNLGTCKVVGIGYTCNQSTNLQVFIQANDGRRLECKASAVCERVPIPELAEQRHADDGVRISTACPAL